MAVDLERLYGERRASSRLLRWLTPPDPLIPNAREPKDFPSGPLEPPHRRSRPRRFRLRKS